MTIECKIIVNEKNTVQFCGSDARSLAVGKFNYYTNYVLQQSTKSTASHTYRIIFHFMLHLLPFTALILNTVTR